MSKENIFRTLQEKELFVTFWGCRFGFHKWLKWREPEQVRSGASVESLQLRCCGHCNKQQYGTLK